MGRDPPVIPEMSSPGPIMRASKGIDDLQTVSNNKQHTIEYRVQGSHLFLSPALENIILYKSWSHGASAKLETEVTLRVVD